jgi:PAS domain-containing protein
MTFWSRSHSLQRKIIMAIVMVGLLPLTFLLGLTYFEERRALRETTGINFKEVAVDAARRIEMHVTRVMNEGQQLATTPFLRTAVTEANRTYEGKDAYRVQEMIKDWQQRWKQRDKRSEFPLFINRIVTNYLIRWHDIRKADYVGILVTDQQGALVVSSIPQVEYFYGKAPWWQALVRGASQEPYVSEITFDPSFGTHVVVVAAPILDDLQKTVIGAVTILLRRDTLFHSIADVTIGSTGHAMLFTSDGSPVICPILAPEEHSVKPELISVLGRLKSGWTVAEDDSHGSKDALVGFAPVRFSQTLAAGSISGKHWVTVVRQDPKETFAPLAELVAKVLLYGLGVFAVLWGTGVLAARRIARPIQLLQGGVQEIGSGRLERRLELKTGDEIEELAGAFNEMASNLQRSFGQIEQRMREVRALEEKYRDLIEHSPEMIYQLDRSGQFVHVNKTGLDKLGYQLSEMLMMKLWDVVPSGQAARVLQYLERLVSQGQTASMRIAADWCIPVRLCATSRSGITWSRNCSITPQAWSRRFPSVRRNWSHLRPATRPCSTWSQTRCSW